MDTIDQEIDIRICDSKPFIYKPRNEIEQWDKFKKLLLNELKNKHMTISTDGYITETNGETYLNSYMHKKQNSSEMVGYISHLIHRNGESIDQELDVILPLPKIISNKQIKKYRIKRLIAGHKNSGTALHNHSRAYFMNLCGEKKWFIAQPTEKNTEILEKYRYDINDKRISSVSKWFNENSTNLAEELDGGEVVNLQANESLFIPDNYYHAVLNLQTTIGVAFSWEKKDQHA
tara:strand:+ start:259 stop:957 length:699 start_codon:yes stop_codon:yes gene_type:complete